MEDSSRAYAEKLQAALLEKQTFINREVIQILTDSVSEYRQLLESLLSALINSRILVKDPYSSSAIIHDLKLPSEEPISKKVQTDEISFRLSEYLRQLSFVENNYEISLDSLSITRITELNNIFNYINWGRLSPTSESPNEKVLAGIEKSIMNGDDNLVKGIFRDSRKQLAEQGYLIKCCLKDIYIYRKEFYKNEVRTRVLDLPVPVSDISGNRLDESVLVIKKLYKDEMGEQPFYSDFIKEIIIEDFSEDKDPPRKEALTSLISHNTVISEPDTEEKQENGDSALEILLKGIRNLVPAGNALMSISGKLMHNSDVIDKESRSALQRFFSFLFGRKDKKSDRIYSVVLFNTENETGNRTKINLGKLVEELKANGQLLLSYGNKTNRNYMKLLHLTPEELEKKLSKHIKELFLYQSKLTALDLHMKDAATNAMRGSMQGFKLDMNDIQSSMFKANNFKMEYLERLKSEK